MQSLLLHFTYFRLGELWAQLAVANRTSEKGRETELAARLSGGTAPIAPVLMADGANLETEFGQLALEGTTNGTTPYDT